ncbi:hypothetical protein VQ300_004810 [Salmonella enterica]|nr:hypothetical protein [Salmonella enterica]EMD4511776.1 hypothetical protein [Salmonella enterica]
MSCFIVNQKTANAIVSSLVEMQRIHESEADGFLDMMMKLNARSVNERYGKDDPAPVYHYEKQDTGLQNEDDPRGIIQAVNNIAFYCYQACDAEGAEDTLIFRMLKTFQDDLTDIYKAALVKYGYPEDSLRGKKYSQLPYSDQCTWGLD